jgi:hypothetical protein
VIRFLFRTVVAIIATGIGLLVAALILDGLKIDDHDVDRSDVHRVAGCDPGDVDPSFPGPQKFLDNRRD